MWEILTFAREQPYESSSDEKVIANLSSLYSAGNAVMVSGNSVQKFENTFLYQGKKLEKNEP